MRQLPLPLVRVSKGGWKPPSLEEPVYWNISLCGHHCCKGLHQPCFELPSLVASAVFISGLVHFSWSNVLDPKSA